MGNNESEVETPIFIDPFAQIMIDHDPAGICHMNQNLVISSCDSQTNLRFTHRIVLSKLKVERVPKLRRFLESIPRIWGYRYSSLGGN